MTDRERVEQQIGEVLATETRAIPLSNKLFSPAGLVNELVRVGEDRRIVARSPLFKQAQRRLTELQKKEAAEFSRAVQPVQATMPESGYRVKLERAENV